MKRKTFITVLIVCLVILIGVVYFATTKNISNTPTPTTEVPISVTYKNNTYGFSLSLPKEWQGYTLVPGSLQFGEVITLRHPLWTKENIYMDVPILIYTIAQWQKWEANNFEGYPTAAPIGPTERGRNARYVFATAPRYNFSYGIGWEAVDTIVENLKAF
ncbi:MAG: hypothetical protein NTV02_03340 [Candidatus Zambryskibacteria bacterium]|nr:hypothetical protein [Candidatus Zambryskibacteria bacterium]